MLKYVRQGSSGAAAAFTVSGDGHKFYIAAEDAGNTYIYAAVDNADGSDTDLIGSEISLISTIKGTGFAGGDFTMVA